MGIPRIISTRCYHKNLATVLFAIIKHNFAVCALYIIYITTIAGRKPKVFGLKSPSLPRATPHDHHSPTAPGTVVIVYVCNYTAGDARDYLCASVTILYTCSARATSMYTYIICRGTRFTK